MKFKIFLIFFFTLFFFACTSLIKQNTQNQQIRNYFLNGQKFLQNEELVQAEIQFRKALAKNPSYAPALNGLAQIALKRGDLPQAESWLAIINENSLDWPPVSISRAQLAFYRGEYEQSLQLLNAVKPVLKRLQLDSLITELEILKLRNLLRLHRWQEAASIFNYLQLNGQFNEKHLQSSAIMVHKLEKVLEQTPEELHPFLFKKVVSRGEMATIIVKLFQGTPTPPPQVWQFDPEINEFEIKDLPANKLQAVAIRQLLKQHILWSCPDQRFYPKEYVNLGEFTIVLYRLSLAFTPTVWTESLDSPWPLPRARKFLEKYNLLPYNESFEQDKRVSGLMMISALLKLKKDFKTEQN